MKKTLKLPHDFISLFPLNIKGLVLLILAFMNIIVFTQLCISEAVTYHNLLT